MRDAHRGASRGDETLERAKSIVAELLADIKDAEGFALGGLTGGQAAEVSESEA